VTALAGLLADDERAALVALPEARRPRAFLTVWTRKEAYLKARGEGLRRDLRDFVVTPAGQPPAVRSSAAGDAGAWTLAELATPDDELVATLAAAAPAVRVRTTAWSL
jgi:4'-phosphopantetheinyl transferase